VERSAALFCGGRIGAGGRAFGTTLGHYYRKFQGERFRRMIANSILETVKIYVPKDGTAADLSAAQIALPTQPGILTRRAT
jgi:hypothetical protein